MFFDTDPAWIEAVRVWAASDDRIARVWVYGSRATGVRTPKPNPSPVPDLDLAFTLAPVAGEEPSEPDTYWICKAVTWREQLCRAIQGPVVELQFADPITDEKVWPAVQEHGVLIYDRAAFLLTG